MAGVSTVGCRQWAYRRRAIDGGRIDGGRIDGGRIDAGVSMAGISTVGYRRWAYRVSMAGVSGGRI